MPNIFHITTDPEPLHEICAADFEDMLPELAFAHVEDLAPKQAEDAIRCLGLLLSKAGFGVIEKEYQRNDNAACFETKLPETLREYQKTWFRTAFDALRHAVIDMTIEDFACGTDMPYRLSSAIDDPYEDRVFLEMTDGSQELLTMSRFVRELKPYATYYIRPEAVRLS